MMLVDLANHAANIYEQTAGFDRREVLARIREVFDVEWECPTDEAKGGLLDESSEG